MLDVLYEDRQLLVVSKPAGLLSQGDRTGDYCVVEVARDWLRHNPAGRGSSNPFVAPVHRLDRPVSGLLVLARTSKSAGRLAAAFRESRVTKGYLAVVETPRTAAPDGDFSRLHLWLRKDRAANRVEARANAFADARESVTRIQVIARHSSHALVALFPETGRPHQLRATLAFLGMPIEGDLKYGASGGLGRAIGLHAHLLCFDHPVQRTPFRLCLAPPPDWFDRHPWLHPLWPPCGSRAR